MLFSINTYKINQLQFEPTVVLIPIHVQASLYRWPCSFESPPPAHLKARFFSSLVLNKSWVIREYFTAIGKHRKEYARLFNLDHYRGIPRKSFTESFAIVDKLVEFLIAWGMQTKERTGRVSTQGPDQIIPYCTRKSFLMMHETLVSLENLLNELGASDLLSEVRLTAMVTLMVENFFSLMRKDDPMLTQLKYGTCARELQKPIYKGNFHY